MGSTRRHLLSIEQKIGCIYSHYNTWRTSLGRVAVQPLKILQPQQVVIEYDAGVVGVSAMA
jgi:hypothetical protein